MNCIFFFKQKTAYEMRISDWSSDVCSSDLREILVEQDQEIPPRRFAGDAIAHHLGDGKRHQQQRRSEDRRDDAGSIDLQRQMAAVRLHPALRRAFRILRSEEHTSELQSLMPISYAVFCLKKKNTTNTVYSAIKQTTRKKILLTKRAVRRSTHAEKIIY